MGCCLFCVTLLHAQNRVGIGTTTPHPSALLDVSGTNGGVLVPRMTEAQRNAINSPTAGLIVHQIFPESELLYFNGLQWLPTGSLKKISQAGRTGWRLIQGYNAFYGNIGDNAVDLSLSLSEASNNGATGTYSMAWGLNNSASEEYSTSWGMSSRASGLGSTSWGNAAEAAGFFSTAFGEHNRAGASFSMAFGQRNFANTFASVAFGRFNSAPVGERFIWDDNDPVLTVGNGTSISNRSNAFILLKNANTGINTTGKPAALLHLRANAANPSWDRHIRLEGLTGGTNFGAIVHDGDGMKFRTFGTGEDFFFRNSNNSSTARIFNNGNMTISGSLTQNSDARLKQDISPIPDALQTLQQIGGYRYHWKSDERDDKLHYGLLAQQVQEVLPHLVSADEEGTLSVNYIELIPLLLEGMKAQQEKIEHLESILKQLIKNTKND